MADEKWFGSIYDSSVGNISKDLLLKTKGNIKIQVQKKFVDLFRNGHICVDVDFFKEVDSVEDITGEGLYLIDGIIFVKIEDNIIQLVGNGESVYVSYLVRQNTTQEQKDTAKMNIGISFDTLKDALENVEKGMVFIGDRIYYINEGNYYEYQADIPNPYPKQFIIDAQDNKTGGSLILRNDGKDKGLAINDSMIYELLGKLNILGNAGINLLVDNKTIAEITQYRINSKVPITSSIFDSKDFVENESGFLLKTESGYSTLEVDKVIERDADDSNLLFDPIQYSKVYTIRQFQPVMDDEDGSISNIYFKTSPTFDLEFGDLVIVSIDGVLCTLNFNDDEKIYHATELSQETSNIVVVNLDDYTRHKESYDSMYPNCPVTINNDTVYISIETTSAINNIKTFQLYYTNKNGQPTLIFVEEQEIINQETGEKHKEFVEAEYDIKTVYNDNTDMYVPAISTDNYIEIPREGQEPEKKYIYFVLNKDWNATFKNKHLFVKAEQNNKAKFMIDYITATIALQENEGNEDLSKITIIDHTVLGNVSKYRTYNDNINTQGLYSDQGIFNGAEFRHPLNYEQLESTPEPELQDIEVFNFPRYSKVLNNILCGKHQEVEEGSDFEDVIPTIRWIRASSLNTPLKEINEANLGDPPATEYDDDGNEIPIGIVHTASKGWQYMKLVPWEIFKKCCDEVKSMLQKFTVTWYITTAEGEQPFATTQITNGSTAIAPQTIPHRKHFDFSNWDYDGTPITEDTKIYADWKYIPPTVHIECQPSAISKDGGNLYVSYWVEWDDEIITNDISVVGTPSNIRYNILQEPTLVNNKVQSILQILESTFVVNGEIDFIASYPGYVWSTFTEKDQQHIVSGREYMENGVSAEVVFKQNSQSSNELPNFDLMMFTMDWPNTIKETEWTIDSENDTWTRFSNEDRSGKLNWEKISDVDGNSIWKQTLRNVSQNWTDQGGGLWKYILNPDLDLKTSIFGTGICVDIKTEDNPDGTNKKLETLAVGFQGTQVVDTNIISQSYVVNEKIEVSEGRTTMYYPQDYENESLRGQVINRNDEGINKLGYDLYQYIVWSGDSMQPAPNGEYTVINFKKIIEDSNKVAQETGIQPREIYIYIKAAFYRTNEIGDFDIKYKLYNFTKDENTGLLLGSLSSNYRTLTFENSPELIYNEDIGEGSQHCIVEQNSNWFSNDYGNPIATLIYNIQKQTITFVSGYQKSPDEIPDSEKINWLPINQISNSEENSEENP